MNIGVNIEKDVLDEGERIKYFVLMWVSLGGCI